MPVVLLMFQSSPGQQGAYHCPVFRFNPHPARRPGATAQSGADEVLRELFQSSPGQKAGCNVIVDGRVMSHPVVSILTRPEGRVQLRAPSVRSHGTIWVSILTRPEGRVQRDRTRGRTDHCSEVSILTRPEGRVQRDRTRGRTDHCSEVSILTRPEGRVQHRAIITGGRASSGFNPHPARRPGATRAGCNHRPAPGRVSILTRPEGRVQLDAMVARAGGTTDVSILTRPEGRVQRDGRLPCPANVQVSILTRPEGRVQP